MTKQELTNKVLQYINQPVEILSEKLSVSYKPDDLHSLQTARGSLVVIKQGGQHFKYYIKYCDFDDYNKFSIQCIGEVVTHDYTPSEDEM